MTIKNFSLKRFLKLDIRWKLRRIGKKIGIHLYPNFFSFKGFKSIYSYFVFNLIFFEKVLKKKKLLIKQIKLISTINDKKVNFIYCLPSSGSQYLRNFFSSYFELRYKIGNGIPKFDNHSDNRWIYSDSPIIMSDLFTNINLELFQHNNDWEFYNRDQFLSERVGISRHPLKQLDLFDINKTKPLILIRDPFSWIISVYIKKSKTTFYNTKKFDHINEKIIEDTINRFNKFYNFWIDFLKDKKKDEYLLINFDDLIDKREILIKILNFFEIPIDKKNIDEALKFNTKDFTRSHLKFEFKGTRFTNEKEKDQIKLLLKDYLFKKFETSNVMKKYKRIKDFI